MDLAEAAARYPTDKRSVHIYIPGYEAMLKPLRERVRTVVEIGIGCGDHQTACREYQGCPEYVSGNSLRMWRDYFPDAHVYGIDVDPTGMIDDEPRITTMVADQSDEAQLRAVAEKIGTPLDLVVDDGSHVGEHQVESFRVLSEYLAPGGLYVIEDVQPEWIPRFKTMDAFPEDLARRVREGFVVHHLDTRAASGVRDDFLMCYERVV